MKVFQFSNKPSINLAQKLKTISITGGGIVALVGLLVLVGWTLDIALLKSVFPGLATMKANTAIAFCLSGLSLILLTVEGSNQSPGLLRVNIGNLCAFSVMMLGLLTLSEYIFGWDIGIDQLLFRDTAAAIQRSAPGRMSPITAINFLLIGGGLLLLNVETRLGCCPTHWLTVIAAFNASLALLGYAYGVESLYKVAGFTSIALHTAITFFVLSFSILFARPQRGLMATLISADAGGTLMRHLFPLIIIIPPVIGWLRLKGQRLGYYSTEFGLALFVASDILIFAFLIFVTARLLNRTDRERRRLETRFHASVEASPVGMIMSDSSGTILLANNEAERMFGYEGGGLLNQKIEVLIPEQARLDHRIFREKFFTSPRPRQMGYGKDLFGLRKDGSRFPVEIGLSPVSTDEGLLTLSTVLDITARKQAGDELKRSNEALARSNVELQSFAYIASHDLQTPLRSISGFVQLLRSKYEGQLDEQADDWIRRTVQSTEQLQTFIRDLFEYSRLDSQARPFEEVSSNKVFNSAILLLDASIRDSQAQVTCDELPTVMGDRTQLVQLMQNLIGNAIKYQNDSPPHIHVSARSEGNEWVFSVQDNGIGIDPKHHERIFEMFKRLHSQQKYPGIGLGLAICRRIVQRHGGRIWVESASGNGSIFYFTMPERKDS